jgi:hypothetical protein
MFEVLCGFLLNHIILIHHLGSCVLVIVDFNCFSHCSLVDLLDLSCISIRINLTLTVIGWVVIASRENPGTVAHLFEKINYLQSKFKLRIRGFGVLGFWGLGCANPPLGLNFISASI